MHFALKRSVDEIVGTFPATIVELFFQDVNS